MMDIQALMALFKDGSGTSTEHAVQLVYNAGVHDGIESVKHKEKPVAPPATPPVTPRPTPHPTPAPTGTQTSSHVPLGTQTAPLVPPKR